MKEEAGEGRTITYKTDMKIDTDNKKITEDLLRLAPRD